MPANLNGPIPGQSLTTEPGNSPWEQPPLHSNVQSALAFYIDKLSDEDLMDDMLFALEQKFPLSTMVESMTTVGVMNGYHTADVSILINPVLHEYILQLAKAADIDVVEDSGPSKEQKQKEKAKKRLLIMLQKDFGQDDPELMKETYEEQTPASMSAPPSPTPAPAGAPPPDMGGNGLVPRRPM
jgi:hypothetical protein